MEEGNANPSVVTSHCPGHVATLALVPQTVICCKDDEADQRSSPRLAMGTFEGVHGRSNRKQMDADLFRNGDD